MSTKLFRPASSGQAARASRVIKNSEVIKVGDFITDEGTGVANVDATGEAILGIVTAITDRNGTSLESSSALDDYDGTWAPSTKQYTAAADNETDKQVRAEFIPVKEGDELLVTLDADKGTTTGSDKAGYYLAILTSDSSLLDESTASATITDTQFIIVDPLTNGDAREVVVRAHSRES